MSIFSIDNTGVRNDEYIIGNDNAKQTKGTIAQIRFPLGGFFPPYIPYFVQGDIRVRDLLNWGFFEQMTWQERLTWITQNGTSNEIYLSDMNCQIRFDMLGSDFTTKLSQEDQQILMNGQWLDMSIVYNMFPKKVGGRSANRHTLIFRGSNWKLYNPDASVVYSHYIKALDDHHYVNLINNQSYKTWKVTLEYQNREIYIGFIDREPLIDYSSYMHPQIKVAINWFTPSVHKSLIQKCIRVRPVNVRIGNDLYPTEHVLITSFIMLLTSAGAFVPNLRKFVSGSESAFKRLAVSLIEDSTCSIRDMELLFGASLASRNGYKPSKLFVDYCIKVMIDGLKEEYFIYDWHNIKGIQLGQDQMMICTMIKTLGSFESDINMVVTVFENNLTKVKSTLERPEIMDIYHCLDHHSITEIVHFYTETSMTSSEVFTKIWQEGTGINSRKKPFNVNGDINSAQRRLWVAKSSDKSKLTERELSDKSFICNMNLDPSWIAGLIGPISNKIGNEMIMSFFNPDDLNNILTIKDPGRDSDLVIDEATKQYASNQVERQMSSNYTQVKSELLGLDFTCVYRMGEFICCTNGTNDIKKWTDYCNNQFSLPIIKDSFMTDSLDKIVMCAFMTKSSKGIERNSLDKIKRIIDSLNIQCLSRLSMYIRNIKSEIQIHKISRDGEGTYLETSRYDPFVFKILLFLCVVIPGVIEIDSSLVFKIKYFPYWDIVRKMILQKVTNHVSEKWPYKFNDTRQLWSNQQEFIDRIMSRFNKGKRGNLIWLDTGLGKTLIVTTVIGKLIDLSKMPKYCVWILTPGSIQNIVEQISRSTIPYNILNGTKGGNRTIRPHCINLIFHDHMILMSDELLNIAPECFFVFDEVHFMFDNSKRTSMALQLSKLCSMFIGMTGTLIKNKNIEGNNLIDWVSQVVEFEVTKKNYMIGIASLISGKIELPIKKQDH